MRNHLEKLKQALAGFTEPAYSDHSGYDDFVRRASVVLVAGGEGSRFKKVSGEQAVHKTAFKLPNGDTMIERIIRLYASVGFKKFVVLAYHESDSITELLGDGTRYGVEIVYSFDPGKPVGKGGAMKHALMQGKIDQLHPLIVHNPDDQLVGDAESIVRSVINQHLQYAENGAAATVVVVEGTKYPYSGMLVEDNVVKEIEMYPFVPIPTHIGMTLFSPGSSEYFHDLIDLNQKTDFESVLFPALTHGRKLYACKIPAESWVSVNDEKGYKKLLASLQ